MNNRILAITYSLPVGGKRKVFLEKCKLAKDAEKLEPMISAIEEHLQISPENDYSNEPVHFSKAVGEDFLIDKASRTVTFLESGVTYTGSEVDELMKFKGSPSLKFLHEQKKQFEGRIIPEPMTEQERITPNPELYRKPPRAEIKPTWDYSKIEQYKVEEKRVCPICQHKSRYSICPGCWFQRGRFIPTTQLPECTNQEKSHE